MVVVEFWDARLRGVPGTSPPPGLNGLIMGLPTPQENAEPRLFKTLSGVNFVGILGAVETVLLSFEPGRFFLGVIGEMSVIIPSVLPVEDFKFLPS
mmetsp:Transcript_7277/g.9475  ORF Transcript_7277/g.9475 Transcript_7277/m.9475 type:complete len:96 (+) Transcript_7277:1104-1391(+)